MFFIGTGWMKVMEIILLNYQYGKLLRRIVLTWEYMKLIIRMQLLNTPKLIEINSEECITYGIQFN